MAIKVKSASAAAEKFASRAAGAGKDYESGVKNPKRSWADATANSAAAYEGGIQQAIGEKRFENGVRSAGDQKYLNGAVNKGVGRYGQGVAAAKNDYAQGVAPYLQTIENIDLPARGPRGSAQNIQRVSVIADSLNKQRLALKGARG